MSESETLLSSSQLTALRARGDFTAKVVTNKVYCAAYWLNLLPMMSSLVNAIRV